MLLKIRRTNESKEIKILSTEQLFKYIYLLFSFKIYNNYFNCIELDSFFTERTLLYSLRTYNTIATDICRADFLYYSSGSRLRRQWNNIPLDIRSNSSLTQFVVYYN